MLPRVLEPEVMDSAEEARDYDSMDHAEVNRRFVEDFLAIWNGANPVLDVGTGTAQIPIELCQQHAAAEVVGIDLAQAMLDVGQTNVQRAGLQGRIRLERLDAKSLPWADESFAAVMSNSIVHHLADPSVALREMVRVCRRGGVLFVRDLLRPADRETWMELVQRYAGSANEHQRAMFAASLQAALTLDEIRGLVRQLGFDADTVRATSDRHWTWSAWRR